MGAAVATVGGLAIAARGIGSAPQATGGGREAFEASCATCHTEKDVRTLVLDATRATMPQFSPGSLSDEAYADILDYVFNATGPNEYGTPRARSLGRKDDSGERGR